MADHGTLIVALGCEDGIVMAADSTSTDTASGTKQTVTKIQQLGSFPMLFGASGDVGLIQRIAEGLNGADLRHSKFKDTRRAIKNAVLPQMKEAAVDHIPQAAHNLANPPTATLMFGCIQNKQPMVLEVECDGRDTVYDKSYGSFNAIGSGKAFALSKVPFLVSRPLCLLAFVRRLAHNELAEVRCEQSRLIFKRALAVKADKPF